MHILAIRPGDVIDTTKMLYSPERNIVVLFLSLGCQFVQRKAHVPRCVVLFLVEHARPSVYAKAKQQAKRVHFPCCGTKILFLPVGSNFEQRHSTLNPTAKVEAMVPSVQSAKIQRVTSNQSAFSMDNVQRPLRAVHYFTQNCSRFKIHPKTNHCGLPVALLHTQRSKPLGRRYSSLQDHLVKAPGLISDHPNGPLGYLASVPERHCRNEAVSRIA